MRQADDQLIRELYPRLRAFACVVAIPSDDPDDLVQDALMRVLRRDELHSLEDPTVYLRRVIVNLASDRRRSLRRRFAALARLGPTAPTTDAYPSDTAALLALSPQTRAVLWLADVEGFDFETIATQLGLTPAAARQRASRGRAELRLRVQEDPYG